MSKLMLDVLGEPVQADLQSADIEYKDLQSDNDFSSVILPPLGVFACRSAVSLLWVIAP